MQSNGVSAVVALFALWVVIPASAQQPTSGEAIYAAVSPSVLLIKTTDNTGAPTSTASGFLIAPDKILTNAHVANAGAMSVSLGAFDVPCTLEKIDVKNDLALCKIGAKSAAKPLDLAPTEPKQGATIFALGNPRGLEKTISEGLFTAYREIEGQQVAQISAPISPGSSGGPIVDTRGQLVGVAVGSRGDGQNLNFAVPLSIVRRFLTDGPSALSVADALAQAKTLVEKSDALVFSSDATSPYQHNERQLASILNHAIDLAIGPSDLIAAYDIATNFRATIQVRAARKVIQLDKRANVENYARLASALYWSTSAPDSADILEAEKLAARILELGSKRQDDIALLGNIQWQMKRHAQAYLTLQRAVTIPFQATTDLLYSLYNLAEILERHDEADRWFKRAEGLGGLLAYQFNDYAGFLERRNRFSEAAIAYKNAAKLSNNLLRYVCDAGRTHWIADELDLSLAALRQCIAAAASTSNSTSHVAAAHRLIAEILNTRNVFDQAEVHAKQSIQVESDNAFAHNQLARSLLGQNRPTEAVSAARNAIRLSDGKYASYHFTLGSAYFGLKQYMEAAQSYEKAAELSPDDSAAAFNVAVSNYNNKYYDVALRWYREALRRNPNSANREEIVRMIAQLSK